MRQLGSTLSEREGLNQADALKLVGFRPVDRNEPVPAGAHLMTKGTAVDAAHDQGYVTSVGWSPELQRYVALGFVRGGMARDGDRMRLVDHLRDMETEVEIIDPVQFDQAGERVRG